MIAEEANRELTSTFIRPDGTIVEHRDDNDPNIYLVSDVDSWIDGGKQKEGLSVVGTENPAFDYQPGMQINLGNRYHNLRAPSPGNVDPDYSIEGSVLPFIPAFAMVKWLRLLAKAGRLGMNITPKIAKQLAGRGWTPELVEQTINKYFTTRPALNKATGNKATAYFNKDGSHVVVDDVTKDVIQVSNRKDISGWTPDRTIVDPYIPKK
jgi:hypothetical protein